MSMIQIRNVPDAVHRELKARAAKAGMSLSDYIRREIEEMASRPTIEEIAARVRGQETLELPEPAAEVIARDRR